MLGLDAVTTALPVTVPVMVPPHERITPLLVMPSVVVTLPELPTNKVSPELTVKALAVMLPLTVVL